MYELVVLNSAVKQLKKLDKSVKARIIAALDKIAENQLIGDRLKGDLSTIDSYNAEAVLD